MPEDDTTRTPRAALERLKRGNASFLSDEPSSLPADRARRSEIARSQAPFAVIVGCADSRVSPELLFSAGLGELFVIRNAGNTIDTAAMGSLEYGVLVLGAPLVVVLGHQRCGAAQAAVAAVQDGASFPGSIGPTIEPILPAVRAAVEARPADGDDLLEAVISENVRRTVTRLRSSEPTLAEPLGDGRLQIVGAEYSLDDGKVDFFME